MKSPFDIGKIKRGKFVDKKSETELFDAMKDKKSKIIYRFENEKGIRTTVNRSEFASQTVIEVDNKLVIQKSYGRFKGIIRVTEQTLLDKYEKTIEKSIENSKMRKKPLSLKNYNKYHDLREKLLNKREVIIRVYILEPNE